MSLHAIVAALGGDLYNGGWRASIPAPGHSADDRSVSLLLSEGRVVIHGFGGADWRTVRDDLRARGFIDDAGRLTGGGRGGVSTPRPDLRVRRETAARLWAAFDKSKGNRKGERWPIAATFLGQALPLSLGGLAAAFVFLPRAWRLTTQAIACGCPTPDRLDDVSAAFVVSEGLLWLIALAAVVQTVRIGLNLKASLY